MDEHDVWALSSTEERILLDNSIERVINTSMRIVEYSKHEDAYINYDDWDNCKELVVKLWDKARNEVFLAGQRKANLTPTGE